jgi:hypothetical protein
MTDDQQSREPHPLAAEIADALEHRRQVSEKRAASTLARRRAEAADTVVFSTWGGSLVTLVGSLLLALGVKQWSDELTEGFVTNGPVVLMWVGGVIGLVGVLLLVRAVVSSAMR